MKNYNINKSLRLQEILNTLITQGKAITVNNMCITSLFGRGGTIDAAEAKEYLLRYNEIKRQLKHVPSCHDKRNTINELLYFYASQIDKLNSMSFETVKAHNFVSEVLYKSEIKEKQTYNKYVCKLERHEYAPELNKLHFHDGTSIRTRGARTINIALNACNISDLARLKIANVTAQQLQFVK